jgi:hypothetical protein
VKDNGTFFGLDIRYSFALNDAFDVIDAYNRPCLFRLMFATPLGHSVYCGRRPPPPHHHQPPASPGLQRHRPPLL